MKDNTRLYRMIKILRLQMNNSRSKYISQTHFALETLAKAAVSIKNLEETRDVDDFPNIGQAEEGPEEQKHNWKGWIGRLITIFAKIGLSVA